VDPWNVPARPSEVPTLAETHALADAACPTVKRPYLFEIDAGGHTSYILGTRHLGVGVAKMPAVVRDKLQGATVAVFEVDPKDTGGSIHPNTGSPLSEQLGDAMWHHLQELAGANLAGQLDHAAPSIAVIQLAALYEDKTDALDLELENLAAEAGVPTQGLETSAFQDALIEQLMDVKALRAALVVATSRADLEKESRDDLGAYCAGDKTDLDPKDRADMLRGGYTDAEADAFQEQILFARNRDWIPKLERILARGNAFIAVGADHLMGPKGVPALLRAKGYTVTRVNP
jgi:uncharacterized protein YbaP (TraB family)